VHDRSDSLVLGHIADPIPSLSFVRRSIDVASHVGRKPPRDQRRERERVRFTIPRDNMGDDQ